MVKDRIKKLLNLEALFQNVEGLIETRIQLFKLELQEQIAQQIKKAVIAGIGILFAVMCLIILSIAFALWIGSFAKSHFTGFLIVGGLYMLGATAVYFVYQSKYGQSSKPAPEQSEEPTTDEGETESNEEFTKPERPE